MSIFVLVADDSPTIRRRAQATLGEAGFDVHCVEDGEKAWEELEGGRKADVLLCDILMPKLDGYELCRRVKAERRFARLPVLLLRGTFEPWDEAKAHDAGADGFITKPFEPENLVTTVRDVLEESAGEEAEAPTPEAAEPPPEPAPAPAPTEPAAPAVASEDPFGGGDEASADAPFGGGEGNPLALGDEPSPRPAPSAPEPEPAGAPAVPAAAPPSAAPAPTAASPVDVGSLDEATLDALAAKVAEKLAGEVLEKLAWDVVPEVAESLVRKRMIEIESKLQGG